MNDLIKFLNFRIKALEKENTNLNNKILELQAKMKDYNITVTYSKN